MSREKSVLKGEALITAVEESAALHNKLADVSTRYLSRYPAIFRDEHNYFKQFLEELLAILSEADECKDNPSIKRVKYLINMMIKVQQRLIKISMRGENNG